MRTENSRQTVSWFQARSKDGTLHLAPPYQRRRVWQDREKAYLADTIVRQLPIPELYVHVITDATGRTEYTVVDGQQRIAAILGFLRDEFLLLSEFSPDWGDRKFSNLPSDIKESFWGYSLVVRELHNASDADVRDLFQRLNRFVFALNAQELRNATFRGEFLHAISELSDDEFWATNRIVTPADIRRMQDLQFVSELLVGLIAGPQQKTETIDDYYQMYEDSFPDKAQWIRTFHLSVSTIQDLVPDLSNSHWRKKSSFYSLFLVIGQAVISKSIKHLNNKAARDSLEAFGQQVELALSKNPPSGLPGPVLEYAEAVGRAASDRDRRLARHGILENLLSLQS